MGLMMNFLSLKETFLISLQGNPIFGVSLMDGGKKERFIGLKQAENSFRVSLNIATGAVPPSTFML